VLHRTNCPLNKSLFLFLLSSDEAHFPRIGSPSVLKFLMGGKKTADVKKLERNYVPVRRYVSES
jgi:hypothetical protein